MGGGSAMKRATKTRAPKRKVIGVAHFTVDFDGMTMRVREFWAECKYGYVMKVLRDGFNQSEENAQKILAGKMRMADAPDGKPGVDGTLLPDSWTPADMGDPFYPDPMLGVAYAEAAYARHLAETENKRLRGDVDRLVREAEERENPTPTLAEKFIDAQLSLEKRALPKPERPPKSANGWLLPNGKFYPCENMMEHIWLADKLGKTEAQAEDLGWVKVGKGLMGYHVLSKRPPTQTQVNRLYEWIEVDHMRCPAMQAWFNQWKDEIK
jgi:hypothetical protein